MISHRIKVVNHKGIIHFRVVRIPFFRFFQVYLEFHSVFLKPLTIFQSKTSLWYVYISSNYYLVLCIIINRNIVLCFIRHDARVVILQFYIYYNTYRLRFIQIKGYLKRRIFINICILEVDFLIISCMKAKRLYSSLNHCQRLNGSYFILKIHHSSSAHKRARHIHRT